MKKHTITIRMGAGVWTVTAHDPKGDVSFDLNAMGREQKGRFFSQFRRIMNQKYGA